MRLTENTDSTLQLTYGSLRESHMEGKFVDGPASYRDRSGQIHELRHNQKVHLDASATSYHLPFLLPPQNPSNTLGATDFSLGDRILAGTTTSNNKSPTTSTLSSLMQNIPATHPLPAATMMDNAAFQQQNQQRYYDRCDENETSVLSTSLTALEVLQAARHRPEILDHDQLGGPRSMPTFPRPQREQGLPPPPVAIPTFLTQDDDEDNHDVFELDME